MKWHNFIFDGYNVVTFIENDFGACNQILSIEVDGHFIGAIRYTGFNIPFEGEVEAYIEEHFSELALGVT
jgi:hypothetical protein